MINKLTRKEKRTLTAQLDYLCGLVHSRNLYHKGQRCYWPEVVDSKLMVHRLHDDSLVEFVEGEFNDGCGQEVLLPSAS